MPNLQRYSQAAMQDLSDAFPNNPDLNYTNLDKFLEVSQAFEGLEQQPNTHFAEHILSICNEQPTIWFKKGCGL